MTNRKRYTPDERTAILADAQATTITAAAAKHGVSPTSIINWRNGKTGSKRHRTADPQSELALLQNERDRLALRSTQVEREIALLTQVNKAMADLAALRQGGAV